ncbi:MAG: DUF4846 domain-containing protein [Deltaproteobacteria bacterium]|nr:DUF4846 domain-containing protein [Deltaproteobacteria bacterium]
MPVQPGSFGAWLRTLPLKPGRPDVLLHDGTPKGNQRAQHAVVDIDVGKQNLQQCADAVMRLHAEYLFATKLYAAIHFRFTSGDDARWLAYAEGQRPIITKNRVRFTKNAAATAKDDYKSFRAYLDLVFTYAGSASLEKELTPVPALKEIEPGDVLIQPGFPGHAVLVVDVCTSQETSDRAFLIAQSYMPAQDVHVLVNPNDEPFSPWYSTNVSAKIETPEWTFDPKHLKRFVNT